jgi:hypothetical protein
MISCLVLPRQIHRSGLPMTIRAGVTDADRTKVPKIIKIMLALAIQRSLEVALVLGAAVVLKNAREALKGSTTVNSRIFTHARKDRSGPA